MAAVQTGFYTAEFIKLNSCKAWVFYTSERSVSTSPKLIGPASDNYKLTHQILASMHRLFLNAFKGCKI
jgi:hypothetical protein